MASFPTIQAQVASSNGTNSPSLTFDLPPNIQAGELLLLIIGIYRAPSSVTTINTPMGWTEQAQYTNSSLQARALGIFYRVATGSEGSTVSTTATDDAYGVGICYRISDYVGVPESSGMTTSGTGAPDPPSLTPSWGLGKNLWIAVGMAVGSTVIQTAPANYSNLIQDANINSGLDRPRVATATRLLEAATEDPGAFGGSVPSSHRIAATIAIQGVSAKMAPKAMHYRRLRI